MVKNTVQNERNLFFSSETVFVRARKIVPDTNFSRLENAVQHGVLVRGSGFGRDPRERQDRELGRVEARTSLGMEHSGRLYRTRRDRTLGGVAGGLGVSLGVHPALVRLWLVVIGVASLFAPQLLGLLLIAYVGAWVALPEMPADQEPAYPAILPAGLTRPRRERVLVGVCAGLSGYAKLNVTLVRLSFVALGFSGVGLLAYAAGWVLMPESDANSPP
jgi:phage shock protein PspC (stress-responsive transcriptional regulator)